MFIVAEAEVLHNEDSRVDSRIILLLKEDKRMQTTQRDSPNGPMGGVVCLIGQNIKGEDLLMRVIVTKDYQAMSRRAAELVENYVQKEPEALISFPGGDTPVGMLKEFVALVNSGALDPSGLRFVQLDDWVGIGPEDEGSCSHFICENLLRLMSRPFAEVFTFNGAAPDVDAQLEAQDDFIRCYGPIGVEVLGIGMNGHLGFNEEGVDFSLRSHRTQLSSITKGVQKKYFGGRDLPLTEGITQGIAQIMEAKQVILLANGEKKAEIIARALTGPVSNHVPASVLQEHPHCICVLDQAAAALLPEDMQGLEYEV